MKNSFNHLWNGDHKIIKGKVFSLVIIQEYQISVYQEVQFKMAWHGFNSFLYFWGYESPRISSTRVGKRFKFALCNFMIHSHASFPGSVLIRVKIQATSSDFSLTPLPFSHSGQAENWRFSFYDLIFVSVFSLLMVANTCCPADLIPEELEEGKQNLTWI